MFEVHEVKVHIFGIPKCLQQCENVGTSEVYITIIKITLKRIDMLLKIRTIFKEHIDKFYCNFYYSNTNLICIYVLLVL
jgi:hypothetical protein